MALRADDVPEFSATDIAAIKQHLFETEHPLTNYDTGGTYMSRYDPDIDIAEAWERLAAGHPLASDLVLLRHEYAEMKFYESHPGAPYAEAHAAANKTADWGALQKGQSDG